jgi:hypothetical protein
MKRLAIAATLLLFGLTGRADAFIFTDTAALVQRASQFIQTAAHYKTFLTYKDEFDKYKLEFEKYFKNFRQIYRRLSSGDWQDFTPSDWARLRDHFIGIWKTFDQAAYDTQVLSLTTSPLYARSPEYKIYADNLIQLSEQQTEQLKREEAHLLELQAQDQAHYEALQRFKSRNGGLVLGEDTEGNEIALSQQIALTNSILIEVAAIQAEQKIVQQRLLTQQKEARNLIMKMKQLEIQAQPGDVRNLDQLLDLTRSR